MAEMDELQREFLMKLGQRIKEIRKSKGLSQSQAASLCDKEKQSYQRVESGRVNPTIWYLQHIAKGFDMELQDLLDIDDLPKPKY